MNWCKLIGKLEFRNLDSKYSNSSRQKSGKWNTSSIFVFYQLRVLAHGSENVTKYEMAVLWLAPKQQQLHLVKRNIRKPIISTVPAWSPFYERCSSLASIETQYQLPCGRPALCLYGNVKTSCLCHGSNNRLTWAEVTVVWNRKCHVTHSNYFPLVIQTKANLFESNWSVLRIQNAS